MKHNNQPPEPKQFCSSNIQVGKKLGSCIRSEGCQHRLPRFPCWVCAMWFLQCIRFGEASHPGPPTSVEWSVGTFNPNGLAHRADVVSSIQGDFWGVTETHLSRIGYQKFVRGLRCNKSSFIHVVPGKHCPFRARSTEAGDFTGLLHCPNGLVVHFHIPSRLQFMILQGFKWLVHASMVCG